MECISTHTPLAGRDDIGILDPVPVLISTHTPLAGRDSVYTPDDPIPDISTHTPLAGRDSQQLAVELRSFQFLLTRPLRDVTYDTGDVPRARSYFYSHAPCGT